MVDYELYEIALEAAIDMCEKCPELEFSSAIHQAADNCGCGLEGSEERSHFYHWAWEQVT